MVEMSVVFFIDGDIRIYILLLLKYVKICFYIKVFSPSKHALLRKKKKIVFDF